MIYNRRKYIRVETPLPLRIISKNDKVYKAMAKDMSPLGMRFEAESKDIEEGDEIELKIDIPKTASAIHGRAKVIWKKSRSGEEGAPYEIGCEFSRIEEDNKNTFLKYFCDLLYEKGKEMGKKGE